MASAFRTDELVMMRALAAQYPSSDAAVAELAALKAGLSLPKGTVHVVSDVHGEYKKLRHIINNASGMLRPLVESLFANRANPDEIRELLAVLYYPLEAFEHFTSGLPDLASRTAWVQGTLRRQLEVAGALTTGYRQRHVTALMPRAYAELFHELLHQPCTSRPGQYVDSMIETFVSQGAETETIRAASRLVRNLSVSELVVAGDLGDRGPRLDRVIDYLMQQPSVSITWGNHDVSWLGACLGHEALIATVVRISLRYRRLSQLEEGYGVIMSPLEKLARTVYENDPAERFQTKGTGLRDDLLMARMQKAIAIVQFKLEGQVSRRHPEWEMEHRNLLHRLDLEKGIVEINGRNYELLDKNFPTVDPADPYELTTEERACIDRLRQSFVTSSRLWEHMSFVVKRGSMWLRRDHAVIFHGCMPVDESGNFLPLVVAGSTYSGRALFESLSSIVRRAFRRPEFMTISDLDWLWYLWTGPRSPLFGKDRMATFENYFIADKEARKEHKNTYFALLNDRDFCQRVAAEFGVNESGLIVNGHVPVKVEKGEEPVKKSGSAVTIDGAFSEAYGDRGYTLILAPERIALAEHHHFESISEAIISGADIVPKVTNLRVYSPPRLTGDTEVGDEMRHDVIGLDALVRAYQEGVLHESS